MNQKWYKIADIYLEFEENNSVYVNTPTLICTELSLKTESFSSSEEQESSYLPKKSFKHKKNRKKRQKQRSKRSMENLDDFNIIQNDLHLDFDDYWLKNGENHVQSFWNIKYYDVQITLNENGDWTEEWINLWHEHYNDISYRYFKVYPQFQNNLTKNENQRCESSNTESLNSITDSNEIDSFDNDLPKSFESKKFKLNDSYKSSFMDERDFQPKIIKTDTIKETKEIFTDYNLKIDLKSYPKVISCEIKPKIELKRKKIKRLEKILEKTKAILKSETEFFTCENDSDFLYNSALEDKVNEFSKIFVGGSINEQINGEMFKYWFQRYSLFTRFDYGIMLDNEGWFSVTPEAIAIHIAERCRCDVVVDAFCGIGGNTIQFAQTCNRAIDIDPVKLHCAKNNAKIYEVEDRIEFIQGDFMKICPFLNCDVLFLSPPWGGPSYKNSKIFDLETMMMPCKSSKLFEIAREITKNIAFFVPKNANCKQLLSFSNEDQIVEVEQNLCNGRIKTITAYYGDLIFRE